MAAPYRAVLFDLLTGLVDSWTLWDRVAGSTDDGRRWRAAYLRNTYATGTYRPYETLVAEAAAEAGLDPGLSQTLAQRYGELAPWPEAPAVLGRIAERVPLGVVTNCSETLGRIAAARVGVPFRVIVTAERADHYKPHPATYALALDEIGVPAEACLFVAGSPFDLFGTATAGLDTYWHDRIGMDVPPGAPAPAHHERSLHRLEEIVAG